MAEQASIADLLCDDCMILKRIPDDAVRQAAAILIVSKSFMGGVPEMPPNQGEIMDRSHVDFDTAASAVSCVYEKITGGCPKYIDVSEQETPVNL